MKTKVLLTSVLACLCLATQGQETKPQEPKGKAIVQVFSNFNFGKEQKAFELERTYLGYEHNFANGLSIKGVMDVGKSSNVEDYHRIAYIKNALVQWKKGNLTLNGGLISTTQFNFQEKFWGHRYIMKSFQDEYKFGSSADLGVSVAYKFGDWLSADAIIVNGEGYKKVQKEDGLNYGLGMTLTPLKGWQIRLYGAINEKTEKNQKNIINLSAFTGYKNQRFSIGAEYSLIKNSSFKDKADQSGYSLFASIKLTDHTDLYARYDDLFSKDDWNIAKDESSAIIGAQFKVSKYVKIAPNFRINIPKASGEDNVYMGYINCYFGL